MSRRSDVVEAERVMIADDDSNIVFAFRKTLEKNGYEVVSTGDGSEVIERLGTENPSVLFLDVSMPGMDGLQVLERIRQQDLDLPVIVITGFGTMQTAIRAVQLGAFEYLTKPLDVEKIRVLTERAIEVVRLRREVTDLRARLKRSFREYEIIGNDPSMQEVYKTIGAVTTTPNATNVLILGESGTGKELVARAIHESGPSRDEPFVVINCTVLPENLLESELFGHEKGAFTGAHDRKRGKFEAAGSGTLFLDEIGDMPTNLQQKLLRVVEERRFQRLGGTQDLPVEARFVAATNRDLKKEIGRGVFREDLFFRLNVVSITVPTLRERKGDIPVLADYFAAKYAQRFGKRLNGVSPEVVSLLSESEFTGNVRELENAVARAVMIEKGEMLGVDSFPPSFLESPGARLDFPVPSGTWSEARQKVLEAFERRYLTDRLHATGGNVTAAAESAGIERQSFQRLMKKYSIQSEDFRQP